MLFGRQMLFGCLPSRSWLRCSGRRISPRSRPGRAVEGHPSNNLLAQVEVRRRHLRIHVGKGHHVRSRVPRLHHQSRLLGSVLVHEVSGVRAVRDVRVIDQLDPLQFLAGHEVRFVPLVCKTERTYRAVAVMLAASGGIDARSPRQCARSHGSAAHIPLRGSWVRRCPRVRRPWHRPVSSWCSALRCWSRQRVRCIVGSGRLCRRPVLRRRSSVLRRLLGRRLPSCLRSLRPLLRGCKGRSRRSSLRSSWE